MAADHLKTFDLVGIKEEVSDFISMISPTDTPFMTSIKTDKIKNTLYQWMEDQLRAVAANAKLQGHEYVDSNRDQPVMRSNGTQILSETFRVSGTADAVALYGRDKATARETMKTGKLLKMDLEHALVGTGQTYVVADESTPGEFAGVQAQIHGDVTKDITSSDSTPSVLGEGDVIEVQGKLYDEGAEASTLMVRPGETVEIASWAADSERYRDMGSSKKVTNVVSVYESPYGVVKVVKNRHLRTGDAILYDATHWKLAVLRPWFREQLAKTGDSTRWAMTGEFGLKHANQRASGLITGIGGITE